MVRFPVTVRNVTAACLVGCFALAASLLSVPAVPASVNGVGTDKPYVFGVFPYLPPRELEKVFAPMAADFSKLLGREVEFVSSTSYEIFAKNIGAQMFDIAFVQPFDYVAAADKFGYVPLATRSEVLKALIVTTRDSAVKSIADLRGKTVSLPPEDAAVSHLTRIHLRKNGLIPGRDVTLSHFRSHMSCLQQVLIESTVACGTAAPALRYFNGRMNVEMRVIGESDAIPHTLFTAHPRVAEADRERLRERILAWGKTPEGKELLARGKLSEFIPVTDAAYDVVRKFPRE